MEVFAFPDYSTFVSERRTSGFVGCVFQYENITLAGRQRSHSVIGSIQAGFLAGHRKQERAPSDSTFLHSAGSPFLSEGHICTLAHLLHKMVADHPKKPSCAMRSWRRMELNKRKSQFSISGEREV